MNDKYKAALVSILGRLSGIDDLDLTKAESQIKSIAEEALGVVQEESRFPVLTPAQEAELRVRFAHFRGME